MVATTREGGREGGREEGRDGREGREGGEGHQMLLDVDFPQVPYRIKIATFNN